MSLISQLAWRFFLPKSKRLTFYLALACLCLGVGCLIVSLAVVSGFETTLKKSVVDVSGDVFVTTYRSRSEPWEKMWANIKEVAATENFSDEEREQMEAIPFVLTQGLVAKLGQVAGVLMQGVPATDRGVNLQSRLISGTTDLTSPSDEVHAVLVGKGFAKKLEVGVGDQIKIVFPIADEFDPQKFRRRLGVFEIKGILGLAKHSYDERYLVADIDVIRKLVEVDKSYSGLLISIPDSDKAGALSEAINREYSAYYRSRDWFRSNQTMFTAIKIEKMVIFFVVSLIVIVAAFNIASSLYINVVQRYRDIAILKSVGLSARSIWSMFLIQGGIIGVVGVFGGIVLGGVFFVSFQYVLEHFLQIPGDVYKINQLKLEIRWFDLLQVCGFTLLICVLSTLAPAYNGSKILITEGLKYE